MFRLIFLFVSIYSIQLSAQDCQLLNSCEYYQCKNSQLNCSDNNFLMKFGYRYCNTFKDLDRKFSSRSRIILDDIKNCLVDSLKFEAGLRCANTKKQSLKHHTTCYTEHGFCEMDISDRFRVYDAIFLELFDFEILKTATQIRAICGFGKP